MPNARIMLVIFIALGIAACQALIPITVGGFLIAKAIQSTTETETKKPRDICEYCYKGMLCRERCGYAE